MTNQTAKKFKELLPDWTVKNQMFDLRICPDCNTLQKHKMVVGSHCDNAFCDSVVQTYTKKGKNCGKLIWTNEEWD